MEQPTPNFEPVTPVDFERIKLDLKREKLLSCRVVTGSMEPIIKAGEMVLIRPLDRAPKPFDILIFHQHDKLICHMYIKESALGTNTGQKEYLTSPYNGKTFDLPLVKNRILGQVCSHKVSLFRKILYLYKRRSF